MLRKIQIRNFNCLADFELELPRRLLLVGSSVPMLLEISTRLGPS